MTFSVFEFLLNSWIPYVSYELFLSFFLTYFYEYCIIIAKKFKHHTIVCNSDKARIITLMHY